MQPGAYDGVSAAASSLSLTPWRMNARSCFWTDDAKKSRSRPAENIIGKRISCTSHSQKRCSRSAPGTCLNAALAHAL